MEEPVRLACPQCELVYRLKKITPGKKYTCKNCGGPLVPPDTISDEAAVQAREMREAAPCRAAALPESDLSRLPRLIDQLVQRLDALTEAGTEEGNDGESEDDGPVARLVEVNRQLEAGLVDLQRDLDAKLAALDAKLADAAVEKAGLDALGQRLDALADSLGKDVSGRVEALDGKVANAIDGRVGDLDKSMQRRIDELRESVKHVADSLNAFAAKAITPDALDALRKEMKTGQSAVLDRLGAHHEEQKREINSLLAAPENDSNTVEVDIDDLADRLVAGVRGHASFLDPDAGKAVDAMVTLAESLVKEQANSTARIDTLAAEIHKAAAGLGKLEDWQGRLPERVADEIGQTVEARVVGPISGALARQAPAILSELQDSKLVDIVSRSVREAQRPLLREILAGGKGGVPAWLFASVLLPLLLILGYLFLPGEIIGGGDQYGYSEEIAESLARIEGGMNQAADNEDRLRTIEDAVLDIHSKALTHVKNAAALEEEVRSLKATLAERDRLIKDYNDTLQNQVKRLREYELRLVQLGVSPRAAGE